MNWAIFLLRVREHRRPWFEKMCQVHCQWSPHGSSNFLRPPPSPAEKTDWNCPCTDKTGEKFLSKRALNNIVGTISKRPSCQPPFGTYPRSLVEDKYRLPFGRKAACRFRALPYRPWFCHSCRITLLERVSGAPGPRHHRPLPLKLQDRLNTNCNAPELGFRMWYLRELPTGGARLLDVPQ
jgi:hypothetical protein